MRAVAWKGLLKCLGMGGLLALSGCAFDVIRVAQEPAELQPEKCNKRFVLEKSVTFQLSRTYNRTLKRGTSWECLGEIEQGEVYRTKDQILTVEASNIFQAHIVVVNDHLVGFYLPVEGTFSPLDKELVLRK